MKTFSHLKPVISAVVASLFILLFMYAALSKLIAFDEFQAQLGHSPLISAFAVPVSYSVIIAEIVTSMLLAFRKSRVAAFYCCFVLMTAFSAYIFIILHYSPYIPCSCGGILEKLGWEQHLIFNMAFTLLAAAAILLESPQNFEQTARLTKIRAAKLIALAVLSCAVVAATYIRSQNIMQEKNSFIRYVPPAPRQPDATVNLQYDSYYFAGQGEGNIFLANYTAPAHIVEFSASLATRQAHAIRIKDTTGFKAIRVSVTPPNFYVLDGLVPAIFTGKTSDWNATRKILPNTQFTAVALIDSTAVVCRTLSKTARQNVLARFALHDRAQTHTGSGLLQRQIDGIFDTDGMLLYSNEIKKMVYLYYYRNQYIVADSALNLIRRGNTIDTTTHAEISIAYIKSKDERQFSAPPHLVNRRCALHRNLLFVNSGLRGRFDSQRMWTDANFIDVYDITQNKYLMSFYVYKIDAQQISDMMATDSHLYAIMGSTLVSYPLSEILQAAMRPNENQNEEIPAGIRKTDRKPVEKSRSKV